MSPNLIDRALKEPGTASRTAETKCQKRPPSDFNLSAETALRRSRPRKSAKVRRLRDWMAREDSNLQPDLYERYALPGKADKI